MEDFIARGDRRIGGILKTAWENGTHSVTHFMSTRFVFLISNGYFDILGTGERKGLCLFVYLSDADNSRFFLHYTAPNVISINHRIRLLFIPPYTYTHPKGYSGDDFWMNPEKAFGLWEAAIERQGMTWKYRQVQDGEWDGECSAVQCS